MDNNSKYGCIYAEIAKGYSFKSIDGRDFYFKHPTQSEYFGVNESYETICANAKSRGLPTEKQQIDFAIQSGWWSVEKEDKIEDIKTNIVNLIKTRDQLLYPSQKKQIESQIVSNQSILMTYLKERNSFVGYTVEKYAEEKLRDEMVINLTYKNKELTHKVFDDEDEYYYLSDDIVEKLRSSFEYISSSLTQENIKLVSATGFFQNMLYVTEVNPMDFWGKPVIYCTKNQIDLLIYGKLIKNLIKFHAETDKKLSDDIISTPEKLVKLLDSGVSSSDNAPSNSSSTEKNNKVTSYVGATKEDLKEMGVKVEKIRGKSLLELAEENGGILEKNQYLNAREGL